MTSAPLRISALLALWLLGGLTAVRGLQLGESEVQLVQRHGTPAAADHAKRTAVYFWDGWSARLTFEKGTVHELIYRKGDYLAETDLRSLLQVNGGLAQWTESSAREAKSRHWTRKDGASANMESRRSTTITFSGGQPLAEPAPPPLENVINDAFVQRAGVLKPSATPTVMPDQPTVQLLATSAPALAKPALRTEAVWREERPAAEPVSAAKPVVIRAPEASLVAKSLHLRGATVAKTFACVAAGVVVGMGIFLGGRAVNRRLKAAKDSRKEQPSPFPPEKKSGLEALRWDQFELLVGELYRREGYVVELSAALGADGGIDLTLRRDSETVLVQCKHWKTAKVSAREMREFYGAMAAGGAPRGSFVTTGSFTRDAREFAQDKSIELVDGAALAEKMRELARPGEDLSQVAGWVREFAENARIFDPECPFCQGAMTVRRNRETGAAFWGCRGYPRCSGKRDARVDLLEIASPVVARAA